MKNTRQVRLMGGFMLLMSAMCLSVPVWAMGQDVAGPVPRWPLVVLSVVIMGLSVFLLKLKQGWHELVGGQKLSRVVGLTLGSAGVFLLAMSLTHAPPLYSTASGLKWFEDFTEASVASRDRDQVMMVDFTAEWCNACHELDAEVFEQPEVRERLQREVVLVKVDFDRAVEGEAELLSKYEVAGLPRVAFVGVDGRLLPGPSFEGKLSKEAFLSKLDQALSGDGGGGQGSEFEKTLGEKGLLSALLLVFVAGFLSSLTPCVYPLIPITIGIFGARGASSRLQGLSLSLVYVLGIALTYSVLGVFAALFGTVFGGAMQHPVVIIGLVVLFVVLGLSSAGLFDLRLPGGLQTKLNSVGGAGYLGAFLMGLVAGIIAAPCVGPIVAGILLYVAKQQDVLLGGGMLFVFAWGLGMIFLFLGTFSSLINRLPRAGGWMEGVKVVFGAVFFGMALYYLRYVFGGLTHVVEGLWRGLGNLLV